MSDTIREHYIPQFYLRNFSTDNKRIYQYQLNSRSPSKLVSIESICCEKNLYEFRGENGEIIYKNLIEKSFAICESEISNVIKSIISKSQHIENFQTLCFLTTNEKAMLILFISMLILRTPTILNSIQDATLWLWKGRISANKAYNMALQALFPIYKELDPDDINLLATIMTWFEKMSFQIGITGCDCLLTCDRPIILRGGNEVFNSDDVIFTLTPRVLLYMKKLELTGAFYKNRLTYLSKEFVNAVNREIIANSNRWIFSKNLITSKQIEFIEKIRGEQ